MVRSCGLVEVRNSAHVKDCLSRPFVRSCLFQASERGRLHEFLRGASAEADRARMLQLAVAPELALEAAQSLEWDRYRSSCRKLKQL